jgi:hypothetical protein
VRGGDAERLNRAFPLEGFLAEYGGIAYERCHRVSFDRLDNNDVGDAGPLSFCLGNLIFV